ncbi:MAG: hypothetical protein ACPG4T_06945 [Nannocystaceae bacterium]
MNTSVATSPGRHPRRLPTWVAVFAGLVLGGVLMLMGLAKAGRLAAPPPPEVLVSLAQTLDVEHQRVDLLVDQGNYTEAIAALENLRGLDWPTRAQAGDAGISLRHDIYGRLMRLRLDHPKVDTQTPDQLLTIANEGLGSDFQEVATNAFTARLVAIQGEVHELRRDDDAALTAYEQALEMNRNLLNQALSDMQGAP